MNIFLYTSIMTSFRFRFLFSRLFPAFFRGHLMPGHVHGHPVDWHHGESDFTHRSVVRVLSKGLGWKSGFTYIYISLPKVVRVIIRYDLIWYLLSVLSRLHWNKGMCKERERGYIYEREREVEPAYFHVKSRASRLRATWAIARESWRPTHTRGPAPNGI